MVWWRSDWFSELYKAPHIPGDFLQLEITTNVSFKYFGHYVHNCFVKFISTDKHN